VVVAQDTPTDGWYEAVVVENSGDMFTLRWRDYPRERRITRHRLSLGLLYPNGMNPDTKPNENSSGHKKSEKSSFGTNCFDPTRLRACTPGQSACPDR
jgi:hypothetical protein